MNHKVSVIIPFFNVEKYFRQCLDSVVNQTHADLEIILVNDGSQDACGEIAASYADGDSRVIVLNQENQGPSAARNVGMKRATGEYVMFIDSDDMIDRDAVRLLHEVMFDDCCDVAISGYLTFQDETEIKARKSAVATHQVLNNRQLMEELASCRRIQNFAWGKMYRREILENMTFPIGKIFEDIAIMYQIFHRCRKGIYISDQLFFYRCNPDSMSKKMNTRKMNDFCDAMCEKAIFYEKNHETAYHLLSDSCFDFAALALLKSEVQQITRFREFMSIYKKVVKKAGISSKTKYLLCKHPFLLKVFTLFKR